MKKQFLTILSGISLVLGVDAHAQKLQMALSGTCSTLDAQGHIVSQPINNQTLLQQAATAGGLNSTSGLGLAYHINGNSLGDTIEVINSNNGTTLTTLYGLYFGESFGRQLLISASHKQMKRLEYVYTDQNSHSLGSALLTDYFFFDNSGNTNATYVLGQMQWIITTDSTHTNAQVCTANFTTLRPWKF
ncbi:MAG TPA: hypothetical protein VKV04_14910 [Verrucomicrobiae bacterium]|nr:hypothetical protein [Verrucomicrobiae bacterium]